MSKAVRNSPWMAVAVWLAACTALLGQEGPITTIDEVLGRDLALLKQADERLKVGATGEAIDIFLPLVEEQGEKLVSLSDAPQSYPFTVYVTLREAILRRILESDGALAEFRKRRGDQSTRDAAAPGRLNWSVLDKGIADQWRARADELIRLGEWNDARDFLNLFTTEREPQEAERLARLAYISLLEGSLKRAKSERDLLAAKYAQSRGRIVGREELLLERVDQWITEFTKQEKLQRGLSATHLGYSIDPKSPVIWRRDLQSVAGANGSRFQAGGFPNLTEGRLFLSTGEATYFWEAGEQTNANGAWPAPLYRATIKADRAAAPLGAMRNLLSSSEGFVFGRLGSDVTRKRSAAPVGDQAPGVIVAHDAARGGVLLAGFPLAPGLEEEFDGPPLVHEGRMFIAVRKRDETRTQLLIRCIDAAGVKTIWERPLCNAETRGRGVRDEVSQTALVLDGERLYVAPHLGCVACLDVLTGRVRWLTKYPRAEFPSSDAQEASRWQRGLGAMNLRGDLLVILAADCERVFALDGLSGKLNWCGRRELMKDAVYVLGATEDEVVLMGESVYWLDAASGQVKACYPERWINVGQDRVDPHSAYGRGIWAGDLVWYPARDAIMRVSFAMDGKVRVTNELSLPTRSNLFGNLSYLEGRLYWASENCIIAWNSPLEKSVSKKPQGAVK